MLGLKNGLSMLSFIFLKVVFQKLRKGSSTLFLFVKYLNCYTAIVSSKNITILEIIVS